MMERNLALFMVSWEVGTVWGPEYETKLLISSKRNDKN